MMIGHVGVSVFPALLSRHGGAIQRRIAALAQAQQAEGHEVVAVSVGDQTRTHYEGEVRVEYLRCRLPLPWRHFEFQSRAVERLLELGVDLIHFHSQPEGAAWVRNRAPTVLSYDFFEFRGAAGRVLHGAYRRALLRFDQLLPCSQHCRDTSIAHWSLPEARTQVLPNGVDLEQFQPEPERAARLRARLRVRGPALVYVGRVCEQKGSDLLLEAFRALRQRRSDVELVIAGPIGQFDQRGDPQGWRERMRQAGARYLGPVDEHELVSLYNLADIFVMPTLQYEMFGMAAVEAQACGKPVVASDHGGLRETVPDGTGLRFLPGSREGLLDALEELLDDPDARTRLGLHARRNAARFSWQSIAQRADVAYAAARHAGGWTRERPAVGQVAGHVR
jgi:glycosyltransferase involved in cell wall biosynthesis